jgi:integrase/recombinase XerD
VFDGTALPQRAFTQQETDPASMTALSFLAQFPNPNTRSAYITDLRIFFGWCTEMGMHPFDLKRRDLQMYIAHLGTNRNNSPATIGRRIGTVTGYYSTAVLDEVIENTPAHHLRLPSIIDDPTKRTWLTRWELQALMHAAQHSWRRSDWALVTLLGTLGMRVSAACAIDLEDMSSNSSGYRMFRTVGKGSKISVKVLPVATWPAIDKARGKRTKGPLLLRPDGQRVSRRSAAGVIGGLCRKAGIESKHITPHSLRRSFATLALEAGVALEVVQFDMDHSSTRVTQHYNQLGVADHARASHTVAALLASAG